MADEPQGLALDPADAPAKRRPRKRRLVLDRDAVVERVLTQIQQAQDERTEWMDNRVIRTAKMRGWTAAKTYPWENASNQHVPILMANNLRIKAGLFNAVLGVRPVMTPKVTHKVHKEAAEQANQLIDYQVFMEADGEDRIDRFITDGVDEGTAVAFTHWVKDRRVLHDRRVFPAPLRPMGEAMVDEILPAIFKGRQDYDAVMTDEDGYEWTVTVVNTEGDEEDIDLSVYDVDDKKIEVLIAWSPLTFDGPAIQVHDLEDIVIPMRAENCQPVTERNPGGAPWVARMLRVNLDHIRRMRDNGTFDLLTDEDMEELEALATQREPNDTTTNDEDRLKRQRDEAAGRQTQWSAQDEDRQWLTLVNYYGEWDLNGDDLNDEAIFWVIKEGKKLARAKYLTEMYPGLPVERPFPEWRYIRVPGQFYGIGATELQEGLHDFLHILFNQSIDNGTLGNQMFFFYRASSGIKPDVIRLWPGEGYPLDNPQTDVFFPTLPQRDQSWAFNMIGLGMQFLDKLTQIGPLQQGQVPQGKASALRNVGTVMAILQQGAAMPEQVLRRLFMGLAQIWHQIHKLNARYLPKKKQYLIVGKPLDQDDAYGMIQDPDDIAVPIQFDFQATLLNTNKGLVSQALVSMGAALINPLTLQIGLVGPEQIYNWAKDLIQAQQLDPSRYILKPAGMPEGPRMTFEEALLLIMDGKLPEVAPLEDPQMHFQKAMAFMQSEQFGLLTPSNNAIFKLYLERLVAYIRQQVQQAQLAQAAQEFSSMLGNQGQGQGAQISGGEPPPVQTEAPGQEEIVGADQRAG